MSLREPLRFATSNPGKLREARELLHVPIEPIDTEIEEIQAGSIAEIALHKLDQARRLVPGPVFVEDVALGFDSLGGFPGPYVKWLIRASGGEGVGKIAAGLDDTRGAAICHLAFWDGETARSFVGECRGRLLAAPRGVGGFGWDAWFLPDGETLTYAEMTSEAKAKVSHRAKAYRLFAEFLLSGA